MNFDFCSPRELKVEKIFGKRLFKEQIYFSLSIVRSTPLHSRLRWYGIAVYHLTLGSPNYSISGSVVALLRPISGGLGYMEYNIINPPDIGYTCPLAEIYSYYFYVFRPLCIIQSIFLEGDNTL